MSIGAKVAAVISDAEVAVNVGSLQGVQVDDVVVVMKTIEVTDPDTSMALGAVTRPKLRLRVIQVQPEMSVAKSIEPIQEVDTRTFVSTLASARRTKRITEDWKAATTDVVFIRRGDAAVVELSAPAGPDEGGDEQNPPVVGIEGGQPG